MINGICIVIVLFSFALVTAYMVMVHKFIKDSEKNGPSGDSSAH